MTKARFDGVYDEFDLDPLDPCVSLDTDGDGEPDWVMTGLIDMSGTGDEQFIVDCDASMWYEDWDDDGDGWSDELEELCGSNHLDGDEMPMDMDQDFVCDLLSDSSSGRSIVKIASVQLPCLSPLGLLIQWQ